MRTKRDTRKERSFSTLLLAVALDPREIGKRIQQARKRRGWTQMEFAIAANVSISAVQKWEAGHLPRVRELMRVADLLEVPAEEFVEEASARVEDDPALAAKVDELVAAVGRIERLLGEPQSEPVEQEQDPVLDVPPLRVPRSPSSRAT